MVYVDDVVANLKLAKLLKREGDLTRASPLAAEEILVEAVEYLVVGEEADLQRVVCEAAMEGLRNVCEREPGSLLLKYCLQPVGLLG